MAEGPDQYQGWRDMLAGDKVAISEDKPLAGFYRRRQEGGWEAVALWTVGEPGSWRVRIGSGATVRGDTAEGMREVTRAWSQCCRYPVHHATYLDVVENGSRWPDELPPANDNMAAVSDIERLDDQIAQTIADANKALEGKDLVEDVAARDLAANAKTKLVELRNEADRLREVEKAPHLKAGRDVDEKWRRTISTARDGANAFNDRVRAALVVVKERAKALGVTAPINAGTRGKKVSLRTERYTKITDYDAALDFALKSKAFRTSETLRRLVTGYAEAELMAGREVPGAVLDTREVAA